MPVNASSSEVRSCISFCAFWGSFQRLGASASLFSSASRAVDFSTSKMPPQQPDRLLDLFDQSLDFRAHGFSILYSCHHRPWAGDLAQEGTAFLIEMAGSSPAMTNTSSKWIGTNANTARRSP